MVMKKVVLFMAGAFILAQLIAIGLGMQFAGKPEFKMLDNPGDVANAGYMFIYVLFSAAMLLLILKYTSGKLLFVVMEFILMLFTLEIVLSMFLNEAAALLVAIAIVAAKFKFPHLRSGLLLLSTSVVGALMGTWIDLLPAALLAIALSAYDVIAVFYTKHMITLAQGLESREASFSISFALGDEKKIRQRKTALKSAIETKPNTKGEWTGDFIELGTGDMVIPAMITVACLKHSPALGAVSLLGSIAGLAILFYLLERRRGYWPALPPLAGTTLAAAIVGLLAGI